MIEKCEGLNYLCRLKSNSVDLVLTDPPYHISRDTGMQHARDTGLGNSKFHIQTKFGAWDEAFNVQQLEPFIREIYRVLKKGGTFICFYDLWKISYLSSMLKDYKFKQLRFIEWVKTNPVPVNSKINYLTNSREVAITAVKGGKPTFHSEYDNGIYREAIYQGKKKKIGNKTYKERCHPTQKSLNLFETLIKKHSNYGELVVDPFLGSGTTLIAALNTGRDFGGCEIDDDYYNKMMDRLKIFYPEHYDLVNKDEQET